MDTHDVGDSRRITATFKDIDGNLADPTTITFKVQVPDLTITALVYGVDPEVNKDSLGVFYIDYTFAVKGFHSVEYIGTGTVETSGTKDYWVKEFGSANGETPTVTEVLQIRSDINKYISEKLSIYDYISKALAQVKREVEDKKDIPWRQVYDSNNNQYFDNTDNTGRNNDRLKYAISLLAIAYVFQDYSINSREEGRWWGMYESFKIDYDNLIDTMILDVDVDESGGIEDGEEGHKPQVFLNR